MQTKYISFMSCSLELGKWVDLQPSYYKDAGAGYIYSNYLSVHNSRDEGAKITLINIFHEQETIKFKFNAVIAIGAGGVLRFNSEEVMDTDVRKPEMLSNTV